MNTPARLRNARLLNIGLLLGLLAAAIASFVYLGIDFGALFGGDSLSQMAR